MNVKKTHVLAFFVKTLMDQSSIALKIVLEVGSLRR